MFSHLDQAPVSIHFTDTFNLTGLDTIARANPYSNASSINDYWPSKGRSDAVVASSLLLQTNFVAEGGATNNGAVSDSTWGPTAIPHFRPESNSSLFGSATTMNATLPVLVPALNCSIMDYVSTNAIKYDNHESIGDGNVTLDMSYDCPLYWNSYRGGTSGFVTGGESGVHFDVSWNYQMNSSWAGYFGQTYWQVPSEKGEFDASCPFAILLYGQFANNGSLLAEQSRFVGCFAPELGSAMGDFTFNLPDLTINATNNPEPAGSTFQPETAITLTLDDFLPDTRFAPFDNVVSLMLSMVSNSTQALSDGNNVMEIFQTIYATSIAQYLSYVQRMPMTDKPSVKILDPSTNLTGTFENPYRARLLQSQVSTRILQAVLGIMLLCAVVTYATLERGDFLPVNPCSIAAKASLLSGARFLHDGTIPPGAAGMSDRELRQAGVFSRESFSMGWWDGQRKRRKRASEVSMPESGDGARTNLLERSGLRYGIDLDD